MEDALAVPVVPVAPRRDLDVKPDEAIVKSLVAADAKRKAALRPGTTDFGTLVATDGSAKGKSTFDRVGGWAIAIASGDRVKTHAGSFGTFDQSATMAELVAAIKLLEANRIAQVQMTLLIDNMNVMRAVSAALAGFQIARDFCPKLWDILHRAAAASPAGTRCFWIPSHGKHEDWTAPVGFTTEEARALNSRADEEAETARNVAISRRAAEDSAVLQAREWSLAALTSLEAASREHMRGWIGPAPDEVDATTCSATSPRRRRLRGKQPEKV